MTTKTVVLTENAPAPMPCLSQGVVVGNMVYVSGSLPIDPKTGKFVEGSIEEHTIQILKNISAILVEAGTNIDNAVKVNIFLTDMSNFEAMNKAYETVFNTGVRPVRTCIAVKALPFGAEVEMEASAHL
ncbi:Endoribonuclease L-PSP/chorismate mutase-like protein [Ilyonectria sp. MPI-CAGE-AT-0026]|nr:Endoribonuclease L-PSP/chorismate mutase-like protein [Ilyonectria sp. MPI-CAGE-AT-0026]